MTFIGRTKVQPLLGRADNLQNLALLFYRFPDARKEADKKILAREVVAYGNRIVTAQGPLIESIQKRQKNQLEALFLQGMEGGTTRAAVAWRLYIGASVGRVWDVGFQLHPLYGIPFLPAAAIKGMLAHYAEEEHPDSPDRASIFGGQSARASVVFLDAFCTGGADPYFEEDVINPHYKEYYAGNDAPPADYCEPEPAKIVTIAAGVRFVFRYAAGSEALKNTVTEWLRDALENYGIGAKTRVGYGRFRSFA